MDEDKDGRFGSFDDNSKILIICIIVSILIFALVMGVSLLGRECVKGHDGSCQAYEQIQKAKEWAAENL